MGYLRTSRPPRISCLVMHEHDDSTGRRGPTSGSPTPFRAAPTRWRTFACALEGFERQWNANGGRRPRFPKGWTFDSRCAGDDRNIGVGRQVHQQLDKDVLHDGIHGRISPVQSLAVDPGVAHQRADLSQARLHAALRSVLANVAHGGAREPSSTDDVAEVSLDQ